MDISLVIPIFDLCEYRLRNLAFILNHISDSQLSRRIYVAEQDSNNNKKSQDITSRFPNVKHITFNLGQSKFNKSKLLNRFVDNITSEFIWVWDVDVYLDVDYVISQLPKNVKLVRPFECILHLNKSESEYLLNTNLIKIKNKKNSNHAFGKYSFILSTNYFKQINGYDENFEGWGFQDLDLISRLPKKIYTGYTKNIAFHLYHVEASRENYNNNKKLFNEKGNFKKLVPKQKKVLDKKTKL
tara:strand:- start:2021 stop:2746 length:726 start_codon:yes stop_codon:yes gene_type:complete